MTRPDSMDPRHRGAGSSSDGAPPVGSTDTGRTRTVLGPDDIARALRRMAHEVIEGNQGSEDLLVLGIPTRGVHLARRLAGLIGDVEGSPVPVGTLDVAPYRDDLSYTSPRTATPTEVPAGGIDDKVVVLTDDVLYSGRTVRAALDALADLGRPRAVRLAVLVDRGHRDLPIRADHVGKNLPTSRRERVHVGLTEVDGADRVDIRTAPSKENA